MKILIVFLIFLVPLGCSSTGKIDIQENLKEKIRADIYLCLSSKPIYFTSRDIHTIFTIKQILMHNRKYKIHCVHNKNFRSIKKKIPAVPKGEEKFFNPKIHEFVWNQKLQQYVLVFKQYY